MTSSRVGRNGNTNFISKVLKVLTLPEHWLFCLALSVPKLSFSTHLYTDQSLVGVDRVDLTRQQD